MKAIRVIEREPTLVDTQPDVTEGVRVKVESSSICGSDLHLVELGFADGRVLGHEFSGRTDDGTAVAVDPLQGCGRCGECQQGYESHCSEGAQIVGVMRDGGMAEYVWVPEHCLLTLPSGLDVHNASLVEPLAVAVHGVNRARLQGTEGILVIGGGPIGLAACAVLHARGLKADVVARHPHQQAAVERLGLSLQVGDGYDVVIDAVGSQDSFAQSVNALRAVGRIVMLGTPWEPVSFDFALCSREIELIPSTQYCGGAAGDFADAARVLAENPLIADLMISHRFPLEAASEGFDTARDRASGAIKVVFEPAL